jgi:hypothetical protein
LYCNQESDNFVASVSFASELEGLTSNGSSHVMPSVLCGSPGSDTCGRSVAVSTKKQNTKQCQFLF